MMALLFIQVVVVLMLLEKFKFTAIRTKMNKKVYIQINDKKQEAKGEQLEYILQAQADAQEVSSRIEAEQQAKEATKESALAKLAALGLTEDEAKAIMGVN